MQARTVEKDPGLVSALDSPEKQVEAYLERLNFARIEGPGITLAYMADDKSHVIILTVEYDLIGCSDNHLFFCLTERGCGSTSPVSSVGFDG
jgi:hypothetical protein